MAKPILVTGGTGTLGREVVRRLIDTGRDVRVLSRRPRRPDSNECSWLTGDLKTGAGLREAVAGVGTIIHCATMPGGSKDVVATRNLAETAQQAGNPHLVYISIVGVDRIPFFYYRAKLGAERLLEDSTLPHTILRATQFHNLVAAICSAQRRLPVTIMPKGFSCQPIDVGEVADRLVELSLGQPVGRAADIGGPEIHSGIELASAYSRNSKGSKVLSLPLFGKTAHAFRSGANLTPEHRYGTRTFEQFLAGRP